MTRALGEVDRHSSVSSSPQGCGVCSLAAGHQKSWVLEGLHCSVALLGQVFRRRPGSLMEGVHWPCLAIVFSTAPVGSGLEGGGQGILLQALRGAGAPVTRLSHLQTINVYKQSSCQAPLPGRKCSFCLPLPFVKTTAVPGR